MDAVQPRVRVERLAHAPRTFPCPKCGKKGRRKDVHTRRVRDIAYREIVVLEIAVGEYRARCSCCKTFRAQVEGIEPGAEYTNRVREAVIDMSVERLRQALQRDFHLDLSDGFLYDCLDWKLRQVEMPAPHALKTHRQARGPVPPNLAERAARRYKSPQSCGRRAQPITGP
jgi:transcription elongation factor Elf1